MMALVFLLMTFLGSIGAISLKFGTNRIHSVDTLFRCGWIYVGGSAYFFSALLNIYLLWKCDYSKILPMTALTYVWTLPLSHFVLGERITTGKIVALILIFLGVFMIFLN